VFAVWRFVSPLWPALAWLAVREIALAWFEDAPAVRAAAVTAAPAVLALAVIAASKGGLAPRWAALVTFLGAILSGLIGFGWEIGRWSPFWPDPLYSWTFVLRHLDYPLLLSSLAATVLPLSPLLASLWGLRRPRVSDAYGSARFMSLAEAKARYATGELVIGEAYTAGRLSARPGAAPLLRFAGDQHILTIGGAGTGKSTSLAIPNCLSWTRGMVALDPKGELAAICRATREAMGHTVLVLEPGHPDTDAINVLDWIDPGTDAVVQDVSAVMNWLTGGRQPDGQNAVFERDARDLVEALLLDLVCDHAIPPEQKTLAEIYRRLADGLPGRLRDIEARSPSHAFNVPQMVVSRFVEMMQGAPAQWQGVLAHATGLLSWLRQPGLARLVSGQGRRVRPVRELVDGSLDMFIAVPLHVLDAEPAVARVLLGAALNAVYDASLKDRSRERKRVLFLLDEMPRLGPMKILQTARDAGRGAGITLWAIVQDLGQLDQCYGQDGAKGWIESSRFMTVLGVRHPDMAQFVSNALGQKTIATTTRNQSAGALGALWTQQSGARTRSIGETGRPLLTPDQVMRMAVDAAGVAEEQLIFDRGQYPLRCGVAKYYRRAEWKAVAARAPST
jgi:type IV secretion system protein VirD4